MNKLQDRIKKSDIWWFLAFNAIWLPMFFLLIDNYIKWYGIAGILMISWFFMLANTRSKVDCEKARPKWYWSAVGVLVCLLLGILIPVLSIGASKILS